MPDVSSMWKRAAADYQRGAWGAAVEGFRACWEIERQARTAHAIALCHWQQLNVDESCRWARQALALDPTHAESHALLGTHHSDRGETEAAVEHHSLAWMHGRITQSAYALAREPSFDVNGKTADDLLGTPAEAFVGRDWVRLLFAKGELWRRRGDLARAYGCFNQGNEILRQQLPYIGQQEEAVLARWEKQAQQCLESKEADAQKEAECDYPWVFVLGLPRCGSTLAERMLATQEDVRAVGESLAVPRAYRILAQEPSFIEVLNRIGPVPASLRASIRGQILDCYEPTVSPTTVLVDKQLWNVAYMGWLMQVFPNARILSLVRHPGDQFVSNYTLLFGDERRFNHSPEDFAHAWKCHRRWMSMWKSLYPGRLFEVRFEDLVRQPVRSLAPLCESLGLPGGDALLGFSQVGGVVTSASQAQVRQSLNTSGLGRWEREKMHVAGNTASLDVLIEEYESHE